MSDWDRIVSDLRSGDAERAAAAGEALDDGADESRLADLHALLADAPSWWVREVAAESIARIEGVAALSRLLRALHAGEDADEDCEGLTAVIAGVVENDPEGAAPALQSWLASDDKRQREDAAWLWAWAADTLPPAALLVRIADPSARVRAAAAGSAAVYERDPDALAALLAAMDDPDEEVRATAASALGDLRDPAAIPRLGAALADPSERVREFAGESIVKLSD